MHRLVVILALVVAMQPLATTTASAAPSGATESIVSVATEPEYRNALDTLSADTSAGPHTIVLTEDISLTTAVDPAYTGTRDLVIDGQGHTLDGGLNSRVLTVSGATTIGVTFEDISVKNGRDEGAGPRRGGAILTFGSLTIRDAFFDGNRAVSTDDVASGGAINLLNGGSGVVELTIENSVFTANRALAADGIAVGGAVSAQPGAITMTGSTMNGNVADNAAGNASGGAASFNAATIDIADSSVTENKATGSAGGSSGGGINATTIALTMRRSVLDGNSASGDTTATGGGLSLSALIGPPPTALFEDTAITGNTAQADTSIADGGGLRINGLTTTIDRSIVSGNIARSAGSGSWGGGVSFNTAASPLRTLTVSDSSITDNQATGATSATNGGGVRAFTSSSATVLTVRNSTVSANLADGQGGQGGGLWSKGTSLDHVTLAGNTAATGANYYSQSGGGSFARSAFGDPLGGGDNCSNAPLSLGYNADDDGTCLFSNLDDLANQPDLFLGQARNNADLVAATEAGGIGAVRPTMYPLAGSILIDAIPTLECAAAPELDLDQRGVDRPFGDGCDIGAIEAVFPAHGFTDATPFFEPTIRWVTSEVNTPQILLGFPDNTFGQELNITRGQAARLYHRGAGSPDPTTFGPHGFSDVTPFYEDAIRWAKGVGLFNGYPDNTFRQGDPITRGQYIRSLHNFAGAPTDDNGDAFDPSGLTDVTPFYEPAVTWAKHHGLANGFPDNTFRQNNDIKRGNAARTFYNTAQTKVAWEDTMTAPPNMLFKDNLLS